MAGPYLVGNPIRLRAVWTDPNNANAPIDPTTVTVKYADPTGTITTVIYPSAPIVKESTGIYHIDVLVTVSGKWTYDWIGSGAVAPSRAEKEFVVLQSEIP